MQVSIILPQDIYKSYLESVNEIKFTRREIDIIAYLLSGRSAKTIAACLSISPKTIEAHMRNITTKAECNSRDGIIDFVEKSKKLFLLKEHYLSLLINTYFEEKLTEIATQLGSEHPTCTLVHWRDQDYPSSFTSYLERHLKLAGIKTVVEAMEGPALATELINTMEARKAKLVLYAIPRRIALQLQEKEEVIPFIQQVRETNNIIALFPGENAQEDLLQKFNTSNCIYNLERENYYDFAFIVLKKLLPTIALDQIISDFKNYSASISGTSPIAPKLLPQEAKILLNTRLITPLIKYINNFFHYVKVRKNPFFIGGMLCFSFICIWFITTIDSSKEDLPVQNKELTNSITTRADLSIPTQSVFLDRPSLIERINKGLNDSHKIQTIALAGMGGAGKTTLARYYMRKKNASVVWELDAESKEDLKDSFESLAEALAKTEEEKEKLRGFRDIKKAQEREEKIVSFVRDKLKHNPGWILIYDNVGKFTNIQKIYFPHDPNVWGTGKIILITRDNNIANNNHINEIIQVGELSPEEKFTLFTKIIANGNSGKLTPNQIEQAKKFLNDIPPFPLDVSIAAYYLKATNVPYKTYLEKLTSYDKDFESVQQTLLEEASEYTKTRYGIITLSLQHIINSHEDFRDLLLFISLLDFINIPRDLLDKYKTSTVVDNFIYNLKKHSLTTSEAVLSSGSTPIFTIHRSTQAIALAYLTKLLDSEKDNQCVKNIGKVFKNYIAEVLDKEDFTKMNLLIKHCEMFLSHPNLLTDFVVATIGDELGSVYRDLGNYEKAKQLFEKSIEIYKKNLHENHLWFAQALGRLGCVYSDQGNYEKAKQLLEESLMIYKNNSYEGSPWFGRTLGWLGNVYREQGNYKKAKQLFEESLIIYKKNSYENHPWFAQALGRLGSIYREQCDYERAKQLLEESLVIYRKNSYENNPWFARALAWLGSVYRDLGNYEKAKQLLEESLAIYKKNSHENHPWFAWTLVWLGNLYREQGNYEKAKQLLEESLTIYKKNSFENHPWFARALAGLGGIYREQGDYEKARQFLEESLTIYKKNSYEKHPWFARTMEHLGNIYKEEGNYEKAKQLLEESLEIYKKNSFENHPWFALALTKLGSVYKDLGSYEKAKDVLELSLQTYEKAYGKDHIDVAPVLMSLGQVHMQKEDIETAENLINKALRIFQTKKQAESYTCLETLSDLYLQKATQITNKKNAQQYEGFKILAAECLRQALKVIKVHFPKDSPHIVRVENKLKSLEKKTIWNIQ